MKALNVSLLLLTVVMVACAPQRRAPTVKATKTGPGIGVSSTEADKSVLDKNANKVLKDNGFQSLDLTKSVSKLDSSVKKQGSTKVEASTAVAKPADKAKDVDAFVIDINGLKEKVRTVVVDKPEVKVASTQDENTKVAIKSNAPSAVYACLDKEAVKPSDCKDIEVRIIVKDENDKDVEIVSNRKLSKSVVVTDVNGVLFGKANVEDISVAIGENNSRQLNIKVVSSNMQSEQKADVEQVVDLGELKANVAISGLSNELGFEHELSEINAEMLSANQIKLQIGLKDKSLGVNQSEEGNKITLIIDLSKTYEQQQQAVAEPPLEIRKLEKLEITAKREKPVSSKPQQEQQGSSLGQMSDVMAP
ncbi:MAG: hypothetical protein IPM57_08445 [Oligoflexia bacterium]|nr:hypothetical protein [Oligoflexia bacterium]